MCGIAGFVDFNHRSTEEILEKMTNSMVHRGPDGFGFELQENTEAQIGLGHRRLSIIDLTNTGKQPMNFLFLWITFNGEIYNYKEVRSELEQLGHSFTSGSDTEVILHAYKEWDEKCLDKFRGMFAFVIYDAQKHEVFCARDRAGVKPLFYYFNEGLFLFSSELKAFHNHPRFKKEINSDAVKAFMQYGNIPTPHCIFENCYKLRPGHYLKMSLKEKNFDLHQYWNVYDAYNKPKLDLDFSEAKDKTEKILKESFEYRMVSDVPVGVFLSGGYDSVSVTSILQKDRTDKLKTFTVSVPDMGLNEAPFAKEIAEYLGTDHTEIDCSIHEALELIPSISYYYDEPFADSSAIPTMLVSKMARKHVTVALSADAGDEVFAGYNRYDYLMRYGPKIRRMPQFVRNATAGLMDMIPAESIPMMKNKYNFPNRYEKMKGILRNPSSEQIMISLSQQFTSSQLRKVFKDQENLSLATYYSSKELRDQYSTPLSYMMAIDYQTYLLDDILQKVDRATMSASLEGREPFLDHKVIEWAAQLPDNFKYKDGQKKYILKEIVHNYVPQSMMDRPKMGFAIPVANWLSYELRELVEEHINESNIKEQGIFNWEWAKKLMDDFYSGKKEYDVKLWYLLMFQMWYDRWIKSV